MVKDKVMKSTTESPFVEATHDTMVHAPLWREYSRWVARRLRGLLRLATVAIALVVALLFANPAFADGGSGGFYQTDIPIEVPAYHGLEPNIRLVYSSSAGNGWLGVGWELSAGSYIQRASPGRGAPNYTASDVFLLDGQELLPCVQGMQSPSCQYPASGYAAYTTKIESFRRIAFDPAPQGGRWYVWSTNGVKSTYAPHLTIGGAVYNWHLERVEDPSGNVATYSYWSDGADAVYLDTISY
jgi:hypothetical protein